MRRDRSEPISACYCELIILINDRFLFILHLLQIRDSPLNINDSYKRNEVWIIACLQMTAAGGRQ